MVKSTLEMLHFGFSMGNTLLVFRDKYYKYGVAEDPMDRTLTIGSYG